MGAVIEIKPVIADYISKSLLLISKDPFPCDKTIHEIRVFMKKARAALRLLANQIENEAYRREFSSFREVGTILSNWRETSVHRKILKDLKKRNRLLFSELRSNDKLNRLIKKPVENSTLSTEQNDNLARVKEVLRKSGYRIRFQKLNDPDPDLLYRELDKTFNKTKNLFLKARYGSKTPTIHQFRKRAKDFLYQILFFRHLNPAVIKKLENKIEMMTRDLGKYNDLAVLINALEYGYGRIGNDTAMDELMVIIRQEQERYLSKIWPAAYRIFGPGQTLTKLAGFEASYNNQTK